MTTVYRRLRGIFTASAATRTIQANTATKPTSTFEKMVLRFKKSSESTEFRSRRDIYLNTVQRLAAFKRFSMIQDILEHQKIFQDIKTEPFTSRLITLYGRAGMFEQAQELFDEMPELDCPRTVYSYNALLNACVDAGRFDQLQNLLKDLPSKLGITLDVVSYNVVVKGLCKMGASCSAEAVLDEMVRKGVEPNVITFNTLLQAFYKDGKFEDAERVWERMVESNVVPDVKSYDAKLFGLALVKRTKEAVELVEEMRINGIQPDSNSFNALIRGFVSDDNLEEAKRWYGEMVKSGCLPNEITLKTLVPFLCEKSDLGFAEEICREFSSRKRAADAELTKLVKKLLKESKTQEVEKLKRPLQKKK